MKLITRYIFKKCALNTVMLLFAFSVIYLIINAIQELGEIGKGEYDSSAMVIYLLAQLPEYLYLLAPLAVLIGVMTGMLNLVKSSEYAIMRTSGISLFKVTQILAVFGLFFAIITFSLGEFVAPKSNQFAKVYKLNKLDQRISTELSTGVWSKDGAHNIINIKEINPTNSSLISGIQIFAYNNNQELKQYINAESASYDQNNKAWILNNSTIFNYLGNKIDIQHPLHYQWSSTIDPSYFKVLIISPDDMPALGLYKYIQHLQANKQAVNRHQISMWSKLLYPLACISMALIAIGFVPNNGRNINLSTKLFIGILIGVTFFFSNKLIGYLAVLFEWNAVLSATIPTVLLFLAGSVTLWRKEN
ncbi:MAG: export transporter permease LptG [Pseudomonadota bacterium]|jgi:lipopolysaccharide export system permease protein